MKQILKYFWVSVVVFSLWFAPLFVWAEETAKCEWIKLNTNVPFVWNCIDVSTKGEDGKTTPVNAFPKLMWSMMNLLMTVILVMSLLLIVYAWVLMTMEGSVQVSQTKWLDIIKKVAVWLALLWASWVILKVINPNFFT